MCIRDRDISALVRFGFGKGNGKLKKIVYPRAGGVETIQIVEAEDPSPARGEVCVRVHRAGVNFAELMMRQGLYGSSPDYPFTPGYETAGEVIGLGEGVDSLRKGDRVLAMTGFGGYAEKVCLDARRVVKIPDSVSFDQAAAIPVLSLIHISEPTRP